MAKKKNNNKMSWIAVIIAAAIGLSGVIFSTITDSTTSKNNMNKIISATQTKEAYFEQITAVAQETKSFEAKETEISNSITETANPLATQTAMENWKEILEVNFSGGMSCPAFKVPDIHIGTSKRETYQNIRNCCLKLHPVQNSAIDTYSFDFEPSLDTYTLPRSISNSDVNLSEQKVFDQITINLSNINSETSWIKIEKQWKLAINYLGDTGLNNVQFLSIDGCGGEGQYRTTNSEINLQSNYNSYSQYIEFEDVDFFTLEQGEFEIFRIFPVCQDKGYYVIEFEIPYQYKNYSGTIQGTSRKIVCAEHYESVGVLSLGEFLETP